MGVIDVGVDVWGRVGGLRTWPCIAGRAWVSEVFGQHGPVIVISAPDGRDHLVDEAMFVRDRAGWWSAYCGEVVVSAHLAAEPGEPCIACLGHGRPTERVPRGRSWWRRRLAARLDTRLGLAPLPGRRQ